LKPPSVLTEDEIEVLKLVKTTPAQAEVIKKRDQGILNKLNKWTRHLKVIGLKITCSDLPPFASKFGCPHCKNCPDRPYRQHGEFPKWCKRCAWAAPSPYDGTPSCYCLVATFGGVSQSHISRYKFFQLQMRPTSEELYVASAYSLREHYAAAEEELNNLKTFVMGHIEWADLVITGKL